MRERLIAERYAEAFVAYANETIGLETALEEFKNLKRILVDNPEFEELLGDPAITSAEKEKFIDDTLEANFSPEMRQFLKMLISKKRINIITDIADYIRVKYSHGETVEAVLKIAYPQEVETIQEIKAKLEKKLDKKVTLYLELDGSLLGGAQIVVGNYVIDGSVKKRLDELKKVLYTAEVI